MTQIKDQANGQPQETGFRIKGWHVLAAMIGFFGIIIAVNSVMVSLALKSFPGEDQKKSYMQGLDYNQTLEQRAEQAAQGWRLLLIDGTEISVSATSLKVKLVADHDRPVRGQILTGTMRRPATDREDVSLTFVEDKEGLYIAQLPSLTAGAWQVKIQTGDETTAFVAETRLWLK